MRTKPTCWYVVSRRSHLHILDLFRWIGLPWNTNVQEALHSDQVWQLLKHSSKAHALRQLPSLTQVQVKSSRQVSEGAVSPAVKFAHPGVYLHRHIRDIPPDCEEYNLKSYRKLWLLRKGSFRGWFSIPVINKREVANVYPNTIMPTN